MRLLFVHLSFGSMADRHGDWAAEVKMGFVLVQARNP